MSHFRWDNRRLRARIALLTGLVTFLAVGASCVRHTVYPIRVDGADFHVPDDAWGGIYYSLPKTVVRFEIPITKTSYKPGPLAKWASVVGVGLPTPLVEEWSLKGAVGVSAVLEEDFLVDWQATLDDLNNLRDELDREQSDKEKASFNERLAAALAAHRRRHNVYFPIQGSMGSFDPSKIDDPQPVSRFALNAPVISEYVVPDADNVFVVKLDGNSSEDRGLLVGLSRAGLIVSAESRAKSRVPEYTAQGAELALRVASAYFGAYAPAPAVAPAPDESPGVSRLPAGVQGITDVVPAPARERLTVAIEQAEEAIKEIQSFKAKGGEGLSRAIACRAQLREAAKARLALLARAQGEVKTEVFAAQLAALDQIAVACSEQFYKIRASTWTAAYDCEPASNDPSNRENGSNSSGGEPAASPKEDRRLVGFNEKRGIRSYDLLEIPPTFDAKPSDDSKDKWVVLGYRIKEVKPSYADAIGSVLDGRLTREANWLDEIAQKKGELARGEQSYFYRIPGGAIAEITLAFEQGSNEPPTDDDAKPLASRRLLVSQFGTIAWLRDIQTSVESRLLIDYYEELGMLKSVAWENTAIDPELLGRVGGAAAEAATAYFAFDAARRAAAAQEPGRLERAQSQAESTKALLTTLGLIPAMPTEMSTEPANP